MQSGSRFIGIVQKNLSGKVTESCRLPVGMARLRLGHAQSELRESLQIAPLNAARTAQARHPYRYNSFLKPRQFLPI